MVGLSAFEQQAPGCPLCAAPRTGVFAAAGGRVYYRCGRCLLTFVPPAERSSRATELATYRQHRNDPGDPRYDPGGELARVDRLLRPGGWLGVMTRMLTDDAGFARWWYRRDPTHVAFFRRETMTWIARRFRWQAAFPGPTVALFHKPAPAHQA